MEAVSLGQRIAHLDSSDLEHWLSAQRPRLLGLVAFLSGSRDAAEDLAQETLLEAWRNHHKLAAEVDADGATKWLNAIARNVCLRWRATSRDQARRIAPPVEGAPNLNALAELPDTFDIEREVEHEELASLLDRALSHLPTLSRIILTQRFVDELPQAEIAARLGITADVVAQRISRGKLLLRQILTTDLRDEAAVFDVAAPDADEGESGWQSTRIWCPFCGQRYLRYSVNRALGAVRYTCAGGCVYPNGQLCGWAHGSDILASLVSPKSILTRALLNLNDHYRAALAHLPAACSQCGGETTALTEMPDDLPSEVIELRGFYQRCPTCGIVDGASLWHLAVDRPETQAFWRTHPRIHALPVREIEAEGRPAYLTGFASTNNSSRVEYIRARDTLEVLSVHHSA